MQQQFIFICVAFVVVPLFHFSSSGFFLKGQK